MRVAFVGGTRFVGPVAVRLLAEAGHDVTIAHSGAHERDDLVDVEHLHGSREGLLAAGGAVERWRPDAIVDTLAGGATAAKAEALAGCARRAGAGHIVVTSSIDVYRHCVDAGLGDGSAAVDLPAGRIPLREDATLREAPYPGARPGHDNVAMERALAGAGRVTTLRPGAIYGPFEEAREQFFVDLAARGARRLELPDGGVQVWHRVAVERVGRAIVAALEHAPDEFWACNVVDPGDHDFASLAGEVGRILDWRWEPVRVAFDETEHPWQTRHPVLCCDERLRHVLRVTEPDPSLALAEAIRWLWERRDAGVSPSPPAIAAPAGRRGRRR